jgi:hypothetical protein
LERFLGTTGFDDFLNGDDKALPAEERAAPSPERQTAAR